MGTDDERNGMKVTVKGIPEIQRKLDKLNDRLASEVFPQAIEATLKEFLPLLEAATPDTSKELLESLTIVPATQSKDRIHGYFGGVGTINGHVIEFHGSPFLRAFYDEHESEIGKRLQQNIKQGVQKLLHSL